MVAPEYAKKRSSLAKAIGLGTRPREGMQGLIEGWAGLDPAAVAPEDLAEAQLCPGDLKGRRLALVELEGAGEVPFEVGPRLKSPTPGRRGLRPRPAGVLGLALQLLISLPPRPQPHPR